VDYSDVFYFVGLGSSCDEVFNTPNGTITTPNYLGTYPGGKECNWTVNGTEGWHILVYIEDIRLASSPIFGSDTVTVRSIWFYRQEIVFLIVKT